jgi:hypothetical protein
MNKWTDEEVLRHDAESDAINGLWYTKDGGSLSNAIWNTRNVYLSDPTGTVEAATVRYIVEGLLAELKGRDKDVVDLREALTQLLSVWLTADDIVRFSPEGMTVESFVRTVLEHTSATLLPPQDSASEEES